MPLCPRRPGRPRRLAAAHDEVAAPLMRPKASRSWRQPFENCTWLIAIVAACGAWPAAKDSSRSTPSAAGTKRTGTPRWIQGSVTAGNSSSSVSTGPSPPSRSAIRFMPVEVLGTNAISSGSAPTKRATLPRTSSRRSSQASQRKSPPASSSR